MTTTTIEAVDLDTGEVLEHLDREPAERLAAMLAKCRADESERKRWSQAIEGELRRRLKALDRTLLVFGEWEVEQPISNSWEWDLEDLQAAITELLEDGTLQNRDVEGVIYDPAPVVSKSKAKRLLARLDGSAHAKVEATYTKRRTYGPLTVTRSVSLLPAAEEAPPPSTPADAVASPAQPHRTDVEELFQ